MLIYIYGVILIFWEIFCAAVFFGSFAEKSPGAEGKRKGLFLLLGMADYLLATFCSQIFIIKEIGVVMAGAAVFCVLFQVTFFRSAIFYMLYQGIALSVDYLTYLVFRRIFTVSPEILQGVFAGLLTAAVSKMLLYCVVLVIEKQFSTKHMDMLTAKEWMRFAVFPVFTIFSMIAMITGWGEKVEPRQIYTLLCISLGMFGVNFIFFYLVQDILKREMQIRKDNLFRERVQNEMVMYRSVSENYDMQRRRAHEFKNQLFCIADLARTGKYQELNHYLKEYEEEFRRSTDMIDTNHAIVNAIINSKYEEGKKKGIVFVFQVNDLAGIRLKDEDVVIILSNLLNNAMEACEQCEGEKLIKLKFVKEKEHLIIATANHYKHQLKQVNGQYQTTKEEKELHGFGISNIIAAVEKYEGSYVICTEGLKFKFTIMIPNESPSNGRFLSKTG